SQFEEQADCRGRHSFPNSGVAQRLRPLDGRSFDLNAVSSCRHQARPNLYSMYNIVHRSQAETLETQSNKLGLNSLNARTQVMGAISWVKTKLPPTLPPFPKSPSTSLPPRLAFPPLYPPRGGGTPPLGGTWRVPPLEARQRQKEGMMKRTLLAAVAATAITTGALAQELPDYPIRNDNDQVAYDSLATSWDSDSPTARQCALDRI